MLLAAPCPMGLSASGRFQKSRCRRSRQSPSPGAWCKKASRSLHMKSWRPAGRLARPKNATCGKAARRSVSA